MTDEIGNDEVMEMTAPLGDNKHHKAKKQALQPAFIEF
jgi:hypothetical protein